MNKNLNSLAPYWLVTLRVFIGVIFIMAGYMKLQNPAMVTGMVTSLGFPVASFFAWALILSEFVGGIMLVLGLFTRWISLPLIFAMLVALFAVHGPKDGFTDKSSFYVIIITLGLFQMFFSGAQVVSLDRLLFKNKY